MFSILPFQSRPRRVELGAALERNALSALYMESRTPYNIVGLCSTGSDYQWRMH